MSPSSSDRIEKQLLLRAPRSRVWRALTDATEFGAWFGVKLEGAFAVGKRLRGKILHPGHEHLAFEITVERIDPEVLFAFRGVPGAIDPTVDNSAEPTTLVEFRLEDAPEGTLLRVTESGFDRFPADRREQLYRGNSEGWAFQLENVRRHVGG